MGGTAGPAGEGGCYPSAAEGSLDGAESGGEALRGVGGPAGEGGRHPSAGTAAAAAPLRRDLPGIRCAAGAMTSWGGAAAPARAARAAGRGGGGCARAESARGRAGRERREPGHGGNRERRERRLSVRGRCSSRCRLVLCGAACRISNERFSPSARQTGKMCSGQGV